MESQQLMRERIQYVMDTGRPLRPAYSELKWLLFTLIGFGIMSLPGDVIAAIWLYRHWVGS